MRFAPVFLVFFIFLAPALALAENASETGNTDPPAMPQGNGPIAVKAVLANGSSPTGMPVTIIATEGNTTTTYRLITGREGNFLLQLGSGNYQLSATLDDMSTPGVDYASSTSLAVPVERNLTIVFYPAGSVAASVLENGQAVPGASVHVSCSSDWFDYTKINMAHDANAGEAGDYLFRALPASTCVISASTQTSAGFAQVAVEQGKLQNTQIVMKPKALGLSDIALALGAVGIVAVLAYHLFFAGRKRPAHQEQAEEKAPAVKSRKQTARAKAMAAPPQPKHAEARAAVPKKASAFDVNSEKARAVLSTLSEREAEIARFLCESGGKAKRSTMQHKLLIPKTSLLRNLRSLERKNVVKLIPFGRNLVAELQRSLFE